MIIFAIPIRRNDTLVMHNKYRQAYLFVLWYDVVFVAMVDVKSTLVVILQWSSNQQVCVSIIV